MDVAVLGIGASLLFSAFFSGMEIAFLSANKLHFELLKKQGRLSATILSNFYGKSSDFIGTCLIGNTLALVVFGIYMATLLDPWLISMFPVFEQNEGALLVTQTIVSTLIVLLLAEFLPKSLFLINPEGFLLRLAVLFKFVHLLLKPFSWAIMGASKSFIRHILRIHVQEDKTVFGLSDLNHYLRSTLGNQDKEEDPAVDTEIFNNALQFKTLKVRDCMIPRTEIVAIDLSEGLEVLREKFIETGHSKILVFRDSIDNIVGYCHLQALLRKPRNLSSIITPILFIPETLPARELMIRFISSSKSIALVVDEYGGTAGLITIEDVIEEIFGEIRDEFDTEEYIEKKEEDGSYILSARLEIDYLNDTYVWGIPT
jgi:CBS domain containing-hemolysin-like protein